MLLFDKFVLGNTEQVSGKLEPAVSSQFLQFPTLVGEMLRIGAPIALRHRSTPHFLAPLSGPGGNILN